MQKVPFLDIKAQNAAIWDELKASVEPVVKEANFILGPAVEQFEREFADYVGVRHCVGVNNGTSALHMALIACNIGSGDEVITTSHTWISTSWAISYVGATPVFVDIDPENFTIGVDQVEAAITAQTKAILPVHLYGQASDILRLRQIANEHSLILIEDAAQAHGAQIGNRRVGSFGDAACFSFYPGKNLGAFGEAGAVTTNDATIADRIRRLRDHAQEGRHHHVELGFNTRMEGIQGAALSAKLPHLDRWNQRRREIASLYTRLLGDIPQIELPVAPVPIQHVWHLFVVLVRDLERDHLRTLLGEQGIAAGVHYPTPVPFQPAYAHLGYRPGDFPVAEDVMGRCLSLPMYPELTDEQVAEVANTLQNICESMTVHR